MRKAGLRIAGIGLFHLMLYGYLVPFVIYPRYGGQGTTLAIVTAVIVSVVLLGTLRTGRNKKQE